MNISLQNKTLVLTGAGGGLGQALAHALARKNNRLILVGRNTLALERLAQSLTHPSHHQVCTADITQSIGIAAIAQACQTLDTGIDGLINNAGISEFSFLEEQSPETIQAIIATNLTAPIQLTQALLPFIQQRPNGLIANIGSSFGSIGYPGFSSYCASKFGLRGFSEALRRELADTDIQISYIAPRAINTAINSQAVVAMNRALGNAMDSPEDVAAYIVRALEKRSGKDSFIGWPEKLFIRLNALLPAAIDSSLRKQLPSISRFSAS